MYTKLTLTSAEKKEGSTNRKYRLVEQFSGDSTPLMKVKLLFLHHATSRFNATVKILEKVEPLIQVQHELLGKLVYDHLATFVKPSVMQGAENYKDLMKVEYWKEESTYGVSFGVVPYDLE